MSKLTNRKVKVGYCSIDRFGGGGEESVVGGVFRVKRLWWFSLLEEELKLKLRVSVFSGGGAILVCYMRSARTQRVSNGIKLK